MQGDGTVVACGFDVGQTFELMVTDGFVDLEDVDLRSLFVHRVFIYADDDLLAAFDGFLILIGRFLDLTLREAGLDRFDHPAKTVDLVKIIKAAVDHLLR